MIVTVDAANLADAGRVHALAWQESHRAFCTPDFVARHTPERQTEYLRAKLAAGARIYLLLADEPVGLVSVTENLIEDLYILPEAQNRGHGTRLLRFAVSRCRGTPVLWILENNEGAQRLYEREGFRPTGRRNHITSGLDEIEFAQTASAT